MLIVCTIVGARLVLADLRARRRSRDDHADD
jgi:hypothetical protein